MLMRRIRAKNQIYSCLIVVASSTEEQLRALRKPVLLPVYGDHIKSERPFQAELVGDSVWIVEGMLPKNTLGGVAYVEIRKIDGCILGMTHGK